MGAEPDTRRANGGADIVGRHKRLFGRTALISGMTLLSRLLGFGREFLAAALFGDRSAIYDAFVTAWRVPNLFRRLLGEGAVSTALQTALTEADGDHGEEAGRALFWSTIRIASALLVAICVTLIGCVVLMGDAMPLTGWRWLGADPEPVRDLMVRLAPFVVFICLAALTGGALAVRGRFVGWSAGPVVMNVIAIGTLVGLGLTYGWTGPGPADGLEGRVRHIEMVRIFAWGLLLSGALQVLILVPELVATGFLRRRQNTPEVPVLSTARGGGWAVLRSSLPLALGAAVYQVNVMVDGFMAQGLLPVGGPTTYYFANRIQQFPLALVATAATSAVFPALKALGHQGALGDLQRLHHRTHYAICFLALPATAGLLALSTPIVEVLFGHGEFGQEGVTRTAGALAILSLGLVPAGAVGLTSRTYYALGDFRTPVRVSIGALLLNLVLNVVFLVGLDMDVHGLALATVISGWVNLAWLMPGLLRRLPTPETTGTPLQGPGVLFRMVCAAAVCGVLAAWAQRSAASTLGDSGSLIVAIGASVGGYALIAKLLRVPNQLRRGRR